MAGQSERSQIIAIGGGKGGVGKSTIAANLAVAMAQSGRKTVIVDLDLGGANLHTLFGIRTADRGIGDYIYQKNSSRDLADYAIPTEIDKLQLISGNGFIPGIANLEYQRKLKIIRALFRLDAEYIILDLGAGTSYNVIDFFALTQSGIVITLPEPTAILNAYEFLKNVLYRVIVRTFKKNKPVYDLIQNYKVQGEAAMSGSVSQLTARVKALDAAAGDAFKHLCRRFSPALILNTTNGDNAALGKNLHDICRNYLDINITYLGAVPRDQAVNQSLFKMQPLLTVYPQSAAAEQIRRITRNCLARHWMNSDLRTQEEQEPPVEEREQRSSLHKSHRVIDITGMLKGHRDTELSSLLADFLEAGFGELKSRDPGLSAPAAIPQHDRDPSLVHAVSELTIDPRLWDALQQPHFSSIDLPPPRRSRFWILGYLHRRTHPHHPTVYQYIATVRKAPMAFDFNKYVDPILSQAPRSPQLGYAWAHAGLQLIDAGKLTSARTAFEQAGKCLPQNSAVRNNHAAVLMAEGKFDAAYELLMEGFKHNPANRYVEYNIALILLQRKQYEKAIDWFAEAGRSDIHSVPAAFLKAYCLYHIGRYREALSIFEALPHNIPYAHQAHFNQGLTLLKLGEYGKAVEVFTSCLNEMPTDADAMAARGWAWWQCSNVEEALKDYTSAIELKPANLSYRTARGFITYKQGKYDLAIEDIETMTRLVPENRQFQLLLQEIRQELSQPSLFRMNGSEGGPV